MGVLRAARAPIPPTTPMALPPPFTQGRLFIHNTAPLVLLRGDSPHCGEMSHIGRGDKTSSRALHNLFIQCIFVGCDALIAPKANVNKDRFRLFLYGIYGQIDDYKYAANQPKRK